MNVVLLFFCLGDVCCVVGHLFKVWFVSFYYMFALVCVLLSFLFSSCVVCAVGKLFGVCLFFCVYLLWLYVLCVVVVCVVAVLFCL